MKIEDFPEDIRPHLLPRHTADLGYRCLGCNREFGIETLLYTCPECKQVLLIEDRNFEDLKQIKPKLWHRIFDYRKMLSRSALKGIYRYHEFLGPIIPLESVVYLGEGHTPLIRANSLLEETAGLPFYVKNDGQNPSASFKDRGMASALSYIQFLIQKEHISDVLAICASTGDTSAAAALYAAYLKPALKSVVLLPHQKVTSQQLAQPLGNGAVVFEIPGVFDDCMKVVENLSDHYNVALLNSKNAWRILGQESYSYEIAQDFEYNLSDKVVVAPIGNAGNITAIISGFLKFYETGIIGALPKIIGVQSNHANPVYRYYLEPDPDKRTFVPVTVKPSVAQAAMIGNPVSMPRVVHMVARYNRLAGKQKIFFVEVTEQAIMDCQLLANNNGHIVCTHGGECLAGLIEACRQKIVGKNDIAVIDSTAHAIKFSDFQDLYFRRAFPETYDIIPNQKFINLPKLVHPEDLTKVPAPGRPLTGDDFQNFIRRISDDIAKTLNLKPASEK